MGVLFVGIIFSFMVLNLFLKDKDYSEQENRMLAERPKFTAENIMSGRYMEEYETYQADQFAGRDMWVRLKTNIDLVMGKREENGVFCGTDHYLMEDIAGDDGENTKHNIEAIVNFAERHPNINSYFMLVPNAAYIWKERLPKFAVTQNQSEQIQSVKEKIGDKLGWIDTEAAMQEHRKEEIYYHTDHHWTSLGAYYAFEKAAKVMGLDVAQNDNLKPYLITNSFNGTLSAKSGYERGYKEDIYAYLPEEGDGIQVVVQDIVGGKKTASLYDSKKLDGKDKYAVFLGGNYPLLDIRTTCDSDKTLLIIKDSYANCFLPFMVSYYGKVIVVDPRYYYGDLEQLVGENTISDILFLYNANTFFEDNSLYGVLEQRES